jgi:hypothetical protein
VCSVFVVSSDEYLNYVMRNRGECDREWERKGREITEKMKALELLSMNTLEASERGEMHA